MWSRLPLAYTAGRSHLPKLEVDLIAALAAPVRVDNSAHACCLLKTVAALRDACAIKIGVFKKLIHEEEAWQGAWN